jgi:hypothetical protein
MTPERVERVVLYRFHLNEAAQKRLPTGFGLHLQALRQSVSLRGEADSFKAFFGARRRRFARSRACAARPWT